MLFEGLTRLALRSVAGKLLPVGRYEPTTKNVVAKRLTSCESMARVLARMAELLLEMVAERALRDTKATDSHEARLGGSVNVQKNYWTAAGYAAER